MSELFRADCVWSGRPTVGQLFCLLENQLDRIGLLAPRIAQVFASLGMKALTVQANCWSTAWDDDVGYEVETERPLWLNDRNDVSARDAKKGDKPHKGNGYVTIQP